MRCVAFLRWVPEKGANSVHLGFHKQTLLFFCRVFNHDLNVLAKIFRFIEFHAEDAHVSVWILQVQRQDRAVLLLEGHFPDATDIFLAFHDAGRSFSVEPDNKVGEEQHAMGILFWS